MDMDSRCSNLEGSPRENYISHPVFWFDDGSVVLRVQDHLFKVHRSFLSRHSDFFAQHRYITKTSEDNREDGGINCDYIVVGHERQVLVQDVEILLEHLYHDFSLFSEAPVTRLTSALRVSSPQQLDFPAVHSFARQRLISIYTGSVPFQIPGDLGEALIFANEYELIPMRKAVYYMLVASPDYDFDPSPDNPGPLHDHGALSSKRDMNSVIQPSESLAGSSNLNKNAHRRILSQTDGKRCTQLMTSLIDHFTPILFTPPATPHRACTDVFADTWLSLVIQPGLINDGVYKPLETLQQMKEMDWAREGLCSACVREKYEEWTEEQRNIWNSIDGWLNLD